MDIIYITAIIIVIYFIIYISNKEQYSQGALQQLMAKGAQDYYLTGNRKIKNNEDIMYYPHTYYPMGCDLKWHRNLPSISSDDLWY